MRESGNTNDLKKKKRKKITLSSSVAGKQVVRHHFLVDIVLDSVHDHDIHIFGHIQGGESTRKTDSR